VTPAKILVPVDESSWRTNEGANIRSSNEEVGAVDPGFWREQSFKEREVVVAEGHAPWTLIVLTPVYSSMRWSKS